MRKFVYPLQYDYLVRQYAYEDKVDPALVASVILVESKFDERGLLSLVPMASCRSCPTRHNGLPMKWG